MLKAAKTLMRVMTAMMTMPTPQASWPMASTLWPLPRHMFRPQKTSPPPTTGGPGADEPVIVILTSPGILTRRSAEASPCAAREAEGCGASRSKGRSPLAARRTAELRGERAS
eukprot:scaffold42629_cov55-Phaeocystis_antarctica.AAC.4